uniref:uncharacterized protein LOC100182654 n=1 Tax=Ciona intestinalis TaxID=7719 RepID=UPI00089DA81C|nr:uncharacterized protein LOC100182654 [Ciona intestinalis]|eukprot:XP_018672742.1 uncharacterized protein LOC100182654 [Ciona intestinalis]
MYGESLQSSKARSNSFESNQVKGEFSLYENHFKLNTYKEREATIKKYSSRILLKPKAVTAMVRLLFLVVVFTTIEFVCFRGTGVNGMKFCEHNITDLNLINNGYGNLTIWIGPEVPENFELVTKLQELITKTSSTLFRLTKKRAYIRNVIIAIPKTWGTPPESFNQSISGKLSRSQTSAQIWVRNSSPRPSKESSGPWKLGDKYAYVSDPYVIKTTPCGFPGAYLRLSPEFVLFGEDMTEMRGAAPEKIVSREWAKLRWGTFDEKARAEDTTKFYLHSDRSVKPTICSSVIPGDVVNQSSPRSPCNEKQRLFDNSCVFVPSKQPQEKTYASLLYRADLPYVNDFCDNGDDVTPEMKHDEEAPTVHNLHCKGRSIWAVIREHPDFKDGNNPPMESDEPPALPNFTLLKGFDRRIVLVLDISTSMENYGRMGLMRQAVSNFIDTVPMNTWVGIVVFASRANTLARLTEITSYDARNILKTRLVNTTVVGTSIGSGIMKGLEVLETSGPRSLRGSGGSIIILTDGLEHNNPKINDTIERVREFGVRVSTIALGSNVAKDLEWLASVSNGRTHAASSGQFGIDAELQEAFASHHEQEDIGSISILSQEVVIEKNSTVEKVFLIDSSIGENTRVAVFYQQKPAPLIAIKTPQNETFFQHEHTERFFFTHDESFQIKTIRIQGNAQVGTWAVVLENEMESTDMRVQVSVTSYQRQTEPLVISPALLCRSFAFTGHEAVVIYANLKQGEHAVLNAYVGAEITRPLSTSGIVDTKFIELKDNGLDPDVTADDGVYSAYFTSFTMQGRYNVKVHADDNYGQAVITYENILGIGKYDMVTFKHDTRYLLPTINPQLTATNPSRKRRSLRLSLPPFQRVSSAAGAFNVQRWGVDSMCHDGYFHFQDACYRIYTTPTLSYTGAAAVCQNEGGDLSEINSRQELSWLLARVGDSNIWFKRVHPDLRAKGFIEIERVVQRARRGMEDFDLDTLAGLFTKSGLSPDLAYAAQSFSPDIQEMSAQQINRLMFRLGLDSTNDLTRIRTLAEQLQTSTSATDTASSSRKKRQLSLGSADLGSLVGLGLPLPPTTTLTTTTLGDDLTTDAGTVNMNMTSSYDNITSPNDNITSPYPSDITLFPAKRKPDVPNSGNYDNSVSICSWFSNMKIIESTADVCQQEKQFVCEKPVVDRFPPSRIIDLRGNIDESRKLLRLSWSAPGDDLNVGRATRYDVRTLRTRKARSILMADFSMGEPISDTDVFNGSLVNPQSPGSRESVIVNLTSSTECPPHAAVDLIFALPSDILLGGANPPDNTKRNNIIQFVEQIITKYRIGIFEVMVSVVAHTTNQQIIDFNEQLTSTQIVNRIRNSTVLTQNVDFISTIRNAMATSVRTDAAKVLIIITDDKLDHLSNISDVITTIVVSVSNTVNKWEVYKVATTPGCKNALIVGDVTQLSTITNDVCSQICKARVTEYQVVGVVAFDDNNQSGDASNMFPFYIRNEVQVQDCPAEPPVTAALATSNTARTVGLALGVPVAALLAILGAVMLVGQIKKWRKNRIEKKEREKKEEEKRQMEEARLAKAAAATSGVPSASLNNNNSNFLDFQLRRCRKTAPQIKDPPV